MWRLYVGKDKTSILSHTAVAQNPDFMRVRCASQKSCDCCQNCCQNRHLFSNKFFMVSEQGQFNGYMSQVWSHWYIELPMDLYKFVSKRALPLVDSWFKMTLTPYVRVRILLPLPAQQLVRTGQAAFVLYRLVRDSIPHINRIAPRSAEGAEDSNPSPAAKQQPIFVYRTKMGCYALIRQKSLFSLLFQWNSALA